MQATGFMVAAALVAAVQTATIALVFWQRRRRRRAEDGLAACQRRLALVADSLPALIVHVDRDERCRFANQMFNDWFGAGEEGVLGRPVRELLSERLYRNLRPGIERALAGEQVSFCTEMIDPRGESRGLDAIFVPDHDGASGVRGVYILALDATDRAILRREVRDLRLGLAEGESISNMGDLAAALAHEINQPLAAIVSNAEAARRFLTAPQPDLDEVVEIAGDIADLGVRAGELIRQMRALVKKASAGFGPVDLNQAAREAAGLVRHDAAARKARIELYLERALPAVAGDRIQLVHVIINMLVNALDAVDQAEAGDRAVAIESRRSDGEVQVTVRDRGPGITRWGIDRLFEPYYTSKPHGLGMGLAISQSIVKLHGGRIWARNNPEKGAAFSFALPVARFSAPAGGARHGRAATHSVRGG